MQDIIESIATGLMSGELPQVLAAEFGAAAVKEAINLLESGI